MLVTFSSSSFPFPETWMLCTLTRFNADASRLTAADVTPIYIYNGLHNATLRNVTTILTSRLTQPSSQGIAQQADSGVAQHARVSNLRERENGFSIILRYSFLALPPRGRRVDPWLTSPLPKRVWRLAEEAGSHPDAVSSSHPKEMRVRHIEPSGRVCDGLAQIRRRSADMHHDGAGDRHHDRHHGFAS